MKREQEEYLTTYLKNLVPNNPIIEYFQSKMFSNTFIVKFQNKINFDSINRRNDEKSILKKLKFKLMPAYNTNDCIIRYNILYSNQSSGNLSNGFKENGFCEIKDFIYQLKFIEPFYKDNLRNYDNKKMIFDYSETCYNLELVSEKIGIVYEKFMPHFIDSPNWKLVFFIEKNIPLVNDIIKLLILIFFKFFKFFRKLFLRNI